MIYNNKTMEELAKNIQYAIVNKQEILQKLLTGDSIKIEVPPLTDEDKKNRVMRVNIDIVNNKVS